MDIFTRIIADGLVIVIAIIAIISLIKLVPKDERYDRYTRILMSGVTAYLLAKFVGTIWQPEQLRPFEKLGVDPGAAYLDNPGFPSDHALLAVFLTLAVWYGTRNRVLTIIMAVLALVMSVGRVMALVHTPFDIAGAWLIAAVAAIWYVGYGKKRLNTHVAKRAKK